MPLSEHEQRLLEQIERALVDDDPKFASDVLHPRLMQALLAAPPMCWRVWGDDLYGWWPGEPAPERILLYLAVLHRIRDEVPEYVWHDYGLTATPSS